MAKQRQYTSEDSLSKVSQELNVEGGKVLYGHAYFTNDNKFIQDQILVMPGGKIAENTVVLIDNVLEELLNGTNVKSNGGKYFFVVITMTSIGDDDLEETVEVEVPQATTFQLLFPDLEERLEKGTSDWAKYWSQKWKETMKNVKDNLTIQKKVINLPGTSWIDQTGNTQTITEKQIQNPSLGDIENLLSMF